MLLKFYKFSSYSHFVLKFHNMTQRVDHARLSMFKGKKKPNEKFILEEKTIVL